MKQHPQILYIPSPSDGSGGVTYPEDHAGLSDGSEFLTNNAAGDTDVADEFFMRFLRLQPAMII